MRTVVSFLHTGLLTLGVLALAGCSADADDPNSTGDGTGPTGTAPTSTATSTSTTPAPTSTGPLVIPDDPVTDPDDPNVRPEVCDEFGNCVCLRLALLGTLDSAATDTNTQPFVDWLNTNSGGSATVEMLTTRPAVIDAAWLDRYDIIVVANVNGWVFSEAEKAAVATWVTEGGGGIISLTGFVSTAQEVIDTSQLISFAGLSYTALRTAEGGQGVPVYFNGGTTDLKQCMVWNPLVGGGALITTPIPFVPQVDALAKLTLGLSYVGAFIGYGVTHPPEATVVATDPVSGQPIAVAHQVGAGKVFVFGDEWVIFANQWAPAAGALPSNQQADQYNPCWVAEPAPGYFHSVSTLYQTKQFWFNAINWVAPPSECAFEIIDEDVILR